MRQTTLCVPLEVKPESCARLTSLIDALRDATQPAGYPDQYKRLSELVPALHFMSLSVFTHASYDPLFILEANFDGAPGVFWGELEGALGPELRAMLRCCKKPLDDDAPLYEAVTASGSGAPVAPYLEARTQRPSVFHHGNRGLTRDRILDEGALFVAIRKELAGDPHSVAGAEPTAIHAHLRKALAPTHPWLLQPAPARIPAGERIADVVRFALFALAVLFLLAAPGLILALLLPQAIYLWLMLGLTALTFVLVWRARAGLLGTEVKSRFSIGGFLLKHALLIVLALAAYAAAIASIGALGAMLLTGQPFEDWWVPVLIPVALSVLSLPLVAMLLVLWLRHLERRDSSQDAPPIDDATLRAMVRREDWIAQNHMGSIVLLKPGALRSFLVHAGHLGLGLLLRVIATNGYLGSMRTVHFAQWAFLNNSSRLLFFSNFDHSWDSYLDDFIEKAAVGLTLAWSSGVGFPPSRFLVLDGAAHGRQFKAWALASRAVSRFWYSAYRDFTVDQIERHARIAAGLRKAQLSDREARAWLRDL